MKRPHLLKVAAAPVVFRPLFEAAAAAGLRIGWLDWRPSVPRLGEALPGDLAAAALQGARTAVSVGEGGAVVVRPRRGPAVLDDVLRQHFLGCALVLVTGDGSLDRQASVATLRRLGDGWSVEERVEDQGESGTPRRLHWSTAELVAALRRPHPWRVGGRADAEDAP